jgi:hypothetical protein
LECDHVETSVIASDTFKPEAAGWSSRRTQSTELRNNRCSTDKTKVHNARLAVLQ